MFACHHARARSNFHAFCIRRGGGQEGSLLCENERHTGRGILVRVQRVLVGVYW